MKKIDRQDRTIKLFDGAGEDVSGGVQLAQTATDSDVKNAFKSPFTSKLSGLKETPDRPTKDSITKKALNRIEIPLDVIEKEEDSLVLENNNLNNNIYGGKIKQRTNDSGTSSGDEYFDSNKEKGDDNDSKIITEVELNTIETACESITDKAKLLKHYEVKQFQPDKISSTIFVTHVSGMYYDVNTLNQEANECINNAMLISSFMTRYTPSTFMMSYKQIGRSQCNQSVFNYPINPLRYEYSIWNVSKGLTAIQYKINNAETIVEQILNESLVEGKQRSNAVANAKAVVKFGQAYAKKIVEKAKELLEQINTVSNLIYPSTTHKFYMGDYSDIFAFLLLSYLYKVDKADTKSRKGEKDHLEEVTEVSYKDILEYERGSRGIKQKEATAGGWDIGNFNKSKTNASAHSTANATATFDTFENESGFELNTEDNNPKKRYNQPSSTFEFYKEKKKKVLFKPGRFQKIVLYTDPNYFAWRLNEAVISGLCLMVKSKILPEQMFTSLKLCSYYSGALFDIKVNKSKFTFKYNTKYYLYANMTQSVWSQYAMFVDAGCMRRIDDDKKTAIDKISNSYPSSFFHTKSNYISLSPYILSAKQLNEVTIQNNANNLEIHNSLTELTCYTRRHFTKTITDKPLTDKTTHAKDIVYGKNSFSTDTCKLGKWATFSKAPDRRDFNIIKKFGDIEINIFKKGIPYEKEVFGDRDNMLKAYIAKYNTNKAIVEYASSSAGVTHSEYNDHVNEYPPQVPLKQYEQISDYINRRIAETETLLPYNLPKILYCIGDDAKQTIEQIYRDSKEIKKFIRLLANNVDPGRAEAIETTSSELFKEFLKEKNKQTITLNEKQSYPQLVELLVKGNAITPNELVYYVTNSFEFADWFEEKFVDENNNIDNSVARNFLLVVLMYFAIQQYLKQNAELKEFSELN